jgi:signal transduction histidine kinase
MNQFFRIILKNRPLVVVVGGFILTIATFIGNILLSYDITSNLRTNVERVENIYSEMAMLSQIETDLSFAENSLKNYFISRQAIYLRSFEKALGRLEPETNKLINQRNGGTISPQKLLQLKELLKERTSIFNQTKKLVLTKKEGPDVTRDLLSQGADKTFEIREILKGLEGDLKVSLQINRKYIERSISYGSYTNYLAIGIALIVAFSATFSITQDYLRQKEIERILRQLNEDKAKLFSILGHDLRSPLSGLNAVIYILKNHLSSLSESEIREYVDSLEQTSQNYGKLLEDVLTWSRLQLDKIQINPQPYEIKLLGQEVIDLYLEQLSTKGIAISNLIPSSLILKVDKAMIQTVLRNLTSNAIKFTTTGGEIRMAYRQDKNFHYLEVIDNGVGMSKAILRTLFTNSTISMAGTENEVGTGLGLSICKEFQWE